VPAGDPKTPKEAPVKKYVIVAALPTLLALGGAFPAAAASPALPTKASTTASTAPAKSSHSKKKTHHVKHTKKSATSSGAPKTAS
jgi:hypothetical protein